MPQTMQKEAEHIFRILIVDDDKSVRIALKRSLSRSDQFHSDITTVESGDTALAELENNKFDLVLSDYQMPGMDGVTLLTRIKNLYPDMIRILITGHSAPNVEKDAIDQAEIHFYLKKPWDDMELRTIMHYAIERNRLEEQLRRYTRDLEEEVQLRVKELIQAEKMASIGQLVAGIAHEINSPLTVISLYAQMLTSIISGVKAEEYLEVIKTHVDAVSKIVSGLLDFSRSSKMERVNIDLNETVLKVTDVLKHQLELSRISMDMDLCHPIPLVFADPGRMQQVIMNMLINAHHAIGRGGKISVSTQARDDSVQLIIADTGKGIEKKYHEKVFEPFFTTKTSGGTGLGLSISKDIIISLDGTIDLESVEGEGATFTITLPINR